MLPAFQSALENMFATQNQIKVDLESCVNVQLHDAAAVGDKALITKSFDGLFSTNLRLGQVG